MRALLHTLRAAALAAVLALPAAAQVDEPEEVEVDRDPGLLLEEVHAAGDAVDTALVFTNLLDRDVRVGCRAFGRNGRLIGRAATGLPARGLRAVLASDFAPGGDFVGSVQCSAGGRVVGEALLLAPVGITNLEVLQRASRRSTQLEFPLVANR